MREWVDLIFNSEHGTGHASPETTVFVLLLCFLIGQAIAWIYLWTHSGMSYSRSFTTSLVVIPVILSLMMLLMSGSLTVAFGLLAVFAVVRFRNVLKDTRDTTFVLWAITEGLAVGTMRYSTAVIGLLGIGCVILVLHASSFGARLRYDAALRLSLSGDLVGGLSNLKQVLHRHANRVLLASERPLSDEGLDLSYQLLLRDPARISDLETELRYMPGCSNVSVRASEDELEF